MWPVCTLSREMIAAGGVKNVERGYATLDFKRPRPSIAALQYCQ